MYDFMYVDPEIMPLNDPFPAKKIVVVNYKKMSIPGPIPKYCLLFTYIRSEDYDLDQNFDDTEF